MADENAASVAVVDNPVVETPSPSVPAAKPSEDEIFARVSHSSEETPATTEEKPSEPVADEPITEEPETEIDLENPPEGYDDFQKFKEKFKGEGGQELRQIVGRQAAITERQPDFQQVVSILERIPNVEELEQVTSDAGEWQRVSQILTERPEEFSAEYAEANPQGFARMAREIPKLLEQTDRNAWIAQRTETFQEILDNAAAIASSSQDQQTLTAIQLVAQSMGLRLGASQSTPRTDPRDAELTKLRKEREERQQDQQRQSFENFRTAVDSDYTETVLGEIQNDLKAALAKASIPDASDAVMKRMTKDVWDRLDSKLKEQPDTQKRMRDAFQAALKDRRMSESDKRSILDFALRKARQTRPAILREVVNEWTKSIIGAQTKKIETRQTVAAQTKDPGTAAGSPPAAAPRTQVNTQQPIRKRSEQEIFASIGQG